MVIISRGVRCRTMRAERGASEIAQFIPSLFIIFLIAFLPLLNLGVLFVAAAIQYLATNDFVSKAATQSNYPTALNTMVDEALQFQSSGFSKFVKMSPQGGYIGCGDDLYVVSTKVGSGAVVFSPPNMQIEQTIDSKANIYELSVKSVYSVAPLVNLSSLPLIGSVPGLGQPVTLTFTANRPVEHPGGLQAADNNGNSGTPLPTFNRIQNSTPVAAVAGDNTWRTPTIFQQIQDAGQTVVSVDVINVPANFGQSAGSANGGWMPTGLVVNNGEKVWLDTQAVGTWGVTNMAGTVMGSFDANGAPAGSSENNSPGALIDADLPAFLLVGYVGNAPVLPWGHLSGAISGDPRFIPSGNFLLNYPITYSGPISLACNDNQSGDIGVQQVRVIITR